MFRQLLTLLCLLLLEKQARGAEAHPRAVFIIVYDLNDLPLDSIGKLDVPFSWERHFGPITTSLQSPAGPNGASSEPKGWQLFGKPWKPKEQNLRDRMPDELYVDYAREIMSRDHDRPFALSVGLVRTHTPLYAAQEYFVRLPVGEIKMPLIGEGGLDYTAAPSRESGSV